MGCSGETSTGSPPNVVEALREGDHCGDGPTSLSDELNLLQVENNRSQVSILTHKCPMARSIIVKEVTCTHIFFLVAQVPLG